MSMNHAVRGGGGVHMTSSILSVYDPPGFIFLFNNSATWNQMQKWIC